jgi:hypothetical protein
MSKPDRAPDQTQPDAVAAAKKQTTDRLGRVMTTVEDTDDEPKEARASSLQTVIPALQDGAKPNNFSDRPPSTEGTGRIDDDDGLDLPATPSSTKILESGVGDGRI